MGVRRRPAFSLAHLLTAATVLARRTAIRESSLGWPAVAACGTISVVIWQLSVADTNRCRQGRSHGRSSPVHKSSKCDSKAPRSHGQQGPQMPLATRRSLRHPGGHDVYSVQTDIERLAALGPPPRLHRHRYHGVAPNARQRAQVSAWARPPTPSLPVADSAQHAERPPALGTVARPHLMKSYRCSAPCVARRYASSPS